VNLLGYKKIDLNQIFISKNYVDAYLEYINSI